MPYLLLLRQANYRRFAASFLLGNLAEGVALVLIPFLLISRGAGGGTIGIVLGAEAVGVLLCIVPAASLADRSSKKRLIAAAYAVAAAALLGLYVCVALNLAVSQVFIASSFLMGCASAFFGPASDALTPRLVAGENLHTANSFDSMTQTIGSRMIGPMVGGLLLATPDPALGIAAAAACYVTAAFSASLLDERAYFVAVPDDRRTGDSGVGPASWSQSVRYLVQTRVVLVLLVWASLNIALQVGGRPTLVPLWIENTHLGTATSYATALACGAVASVATSLLVGALKRPRKYVAVMILGWSLGPLGMLLLLWSPTSMSLVISFIVYGIGAAVGNIYWSTLLQERVPERLRTKVISLDWMASLAFVPLGSSVLGAVSDASGVAPLLGILALAPVAMAILVLPLLGAPGRRFAGSLP